MIINRAWAMPNAWYEQYQNEALIYNTWIEMDLNINAQNSKGAHEGEMY